MALKKSELYSSLWSSCDELRGSMDASKYNVAALEETVAAHLAKTGFEL
ncbi:MAG: hypothetical protein AAF152_02060 [Cyanobacteria bacterium P01_A01_bin.114]